MKKTNNNKSNIRIVAINVPAIPNRGGMAITMGFINCINKSIPDAEIIFVTRVRGNEIYKNYGVTMYDHPWYKENSSKVKTYLLCSIRILNDLIKCTFCNAFGIPKERIMNDFYSCDVIVDLSCDVNDSYFGFFGPTLTIYSLLNASIFKIISRKPLLIGASSINLNNKISILLAKFVYGRIHNLITVREKYTANHLYKLKINKSKIVLTADYAFLLEAASNEKVKELLTKLEINKSSRPIVGLAPSMLIYRYSFPDINEEEKYNRYLEILIKLIYYLTQI